MVRGMAASGGSTSAHHTTRARGAATAPRASAREHAALEVGERRAAARPVVFITNGPYCAIGSPSGRPGDEQHARRLAGRRRTRSAHRRRRRRWPRIAIRSGSTRRRLPSPPIVDRRRTEHVGERVVTGGQRGVERAPGRQREVEHDRLGRRPRHRAGGAVARRRRSRARARRRRASSTGTSAGRDVAVAGRRHLVLRRRG